MDGGKTGGNVLYERRIYFFKTKCIIKKIKLKKSTDALTNLMQAFATKPEFMSSVSGNYMDKERSYS